MAAGIKHFVLDASVTLAWCFEDERTAYTERILDQLAAGGEADVPAIWTFEVANGLLVAERRKRITSGQVATFWRRIEQLPIAIESPTFPIDAVLAVARSQELAAYDASYLEIAQRKDLPIATLDEALRKAASRLGVPLVR